MSTIEKPQTQERQLPISPEKQQKITEIRQKLDENNGIETQSSIENLTNGIDSERFKDLKNTIEGSIENILNNYDFLDIQTKNFLKISIIKEVIQSPIMGVLGDLAISFTSFMNDLQNMNLENIINLLERRKTPTESSGRVNDVIGMFNNIISSYINKLNEIQNFFKDKNLTPQEKQNILSNIDFFRDPTKISQIKNFDVKTIDISKTTKRQLNSEEKDRLAKTLVELKESFEKIALKLKVGDKVSNGLLDVISSGGKIGEGIKELTNWLLEIPILGKFLAIFLGLDPNNPEASLEESLKAHEIIKGLKSLGVSKDKDGQINNGKPPFEDIDLSGIQTNIVKNEINELQKLFPELKKENSSDFWQKAFGKDGYGENNPKFILKLTDKHKEDKKLDSLELKDLLKKGIKDYKDKIDNKNTEEKTAKQGQELADKKQKETSLRGEITTLDSKINWINKILNKDYEKIKHWDDVFNIGDIVDIKIQDILNNSNNDFSQIISQEIGKDDFELIHKEFLNVFFSYIKEYCNENKDKIKNGEITLKDFLKNNETEFFKWLENKKAALIQEKTTKQNELNELTGKIKEADFANKVGEKIKGLTDGTSLLGRGIDIGDGKKLSFDKEKQELTIGDNKYKIQLKNKDESLKLKDIKITAGKVEFVPDIEDGKLILGRNLNPDLGFISKEQIINGIKDLIINGEYIYKKDDIELKFSKIS